MCITSPPYWGLRDYGTDPQIWDAGDEEVFISYRGDKDFYRSEKTIKTPCEHEWVEHIKKPNGGKGSKGANVGANKNDFANMRDHDIKTDFCSKCGAWRGSLGLEPTFELYIKHLCDIFDEVNRVLRNDGTCWVNLGDSYGGSGNASGHTEDTKNLGYKTSEMGATEGNQKATKGYEKSLLLIPQRFAIEMVNRGWILRNTIIWHKPNCMPSSAKDRFTVDFEYLYFFTKSNKTQFWTNSKTGDCVRKQPLGIKGIEGIDWEWKEVGNNYSNSETKIDKEIAEKLSSPRARKYREVKRKKVSLWTGHDYYFEQQFEKYQFPLDRWGGIYTDGNVPNSKYLKEDIDPAQITKRPRSFRPNEKGRNKRTVWEINTRPFPEAHFAVFPEALIETPIKAGCPKNGVVLDPFIGSGTTARVALKQGKRYLGIDLKQEYIDMANKGIKKVHPTLF